MECYNPYIVFLSSVFDAIISIRCTDFRDVITFGILGTVNSRHNQMYVVRKMKEKLLIPPFYSPDEIPLHATNTAIISLIMFLLGSSLVNLKRE